MSFLGVRWIRRVTFVRRELVGLVCGLALMPGSLVKDVLNSFGLMATCVAPAN